MADFSGVRTLVFRVGDLLCGADVSAVREILPPRRATPIPGASDAVAGLINVRGRLLTLVDGRRALGQRPANGTGSIVLLDVGQQTVGFAVDEVVDLFTVPGQELSRRDDLPGIDPRAVWAVGRHADLSIVILDIDALLGPVFSD